MSLLQQIQDAAVDGSASLGEVLRKCKVLASRLGSSPLEEWLLHESNGYPEQITVPEYRAWPLKLTGIFDGPFGACLRNYPVPLAVLPKRISKSYSSYECRQSVAVTENVLKGNPSTLHVSTGDLNLILGAKVYQGYNCVSVEASFSTTNLTELLDTVRNRILDFSIALWKEFPSAGESPTESKSEIPPSQITQIFQTTIHGGTANVVGSAQGSSFGGQIIQHDLDSLCEAMRRLEVPEDDVSKLRKSVLEDEQSGSDTPGPRVTTWLGGMCKKAIEGLWTAGASEGGKLLIDAISKYRGH